MSAVAIEILDYHGNRPTSNDKLKWAVLRCLVEKTKNSIVFKQSLNSMCHMRCAINYSCFFIIDPAR